MNILSIQSYVSYGHVGNSAAVFCFQLFGFDVWPIPTALLSNHPGHPSFRGQKFTASTIQDLILGLSDLGVLNRCDAVISGYFSDPDISELIANIVNQIKSANPAAVYLCDPVMGNDERGLYVPGEVPKAIASNLIPIADIVTPNRFELEQLCKLTVATKEDAAAALHKVTTQGPLVAVCTSAPTSSSRAMAVLGCYGSKTWVIETPRCITMANGRGDCLSAILLAHHLSGKSLERSLSLSVSAVYDLIQMAGNNARDLPLVAGQGRILQPTQIFTPQLLKPGSYM
jgi:pyridoxine kinase